MALSCQINCKILPEYPERGLGLISSHWFRSAIPFLLPSRWKKHQQPCCQDSFKKFRACKQMVPISCAILYFGTYPGTNPKNKSDTPCLNWQAAESCGKFWLHHVWAKADYYTLVGPQTASACMFLFINTILDYSSWCWQFLIRAWVTSNLSHATRFRFFATAFVSVTIRGRQGRRQGGDKW
jgi:hypothetical protein